MSNVTVEEAREGLEAIGMWMDARYHLRFIGQPIQAWDMPRKEKEFFTVYVMNITLESEGFDCLIRQKPEDVKVFVKMLRRIGASETSDFVQSKLSTLKNKTPREEDECTSKYYKLFKREKVWPKLLDELGRRIYMRYLRRAQAIRAIGENIFDPKQWQGDLSDKKWWEMWK